MKRAVIYTRVSTSQQERKGMSLETQYLVCQQKAKQIGAVVVAAFEEQHSGADYEDREGLQNALKVIERGDAEILICHDMSRYSRDVMHQQQILKRIMKAGGELVFTTFDVGDPHTDAKAYLQFTVSGVFDNYERMIITSKMMLNRRRSAEKGLQVTHSAPYGYEIATRPLIMEGRYRPADHKKYFQVPKKAAIVKEIFHAYADGASLYGICRDLNARGIPSPKGKQWRPTTVRAMFLNETYKGMAHFGKYATRQDVDRKARGLKSKTYLVPAPEETRITIPVEPIVTEAIWDTCQTRLKKNQKRIGGRPTVKHLLTGLLRCPLCDRKMSGSRIRGYIKYICPATLRYYADGRCTAPMLYSHSVHSLVMDAIAEQIADPQLLEISLTEGIPKPPLDFNLAKATRELKELKAEERLTVQGQIRALKSGVDSEVYEEELTRIATRRKVLEEQVKAAQESAKAPAKIRSRAQELATKIAGVMERLADPTALDVEKNEILRRLITHIYVQENQVEIKWRDTP